MQDIAFSQKTKPQEHLLCIGSNRFNIDTDVSSELLEDLTKVDATEV